MLRRLTFTRTLHTLLTAAALVVSLNPLHAQCVMDLGSLGTSAMVLVQSGDVTQLGDRAGYRQILKPCATVKQQQVIRTGADGYAKFQVSDGSTFEVFPNTELTFRKTFGVTDLLNVWMGKVKVYIQHLPGVPNPNNVVTPTALISVRGTIFDVDVQSLDGTTFVTLDEGLVDVRHLQVASRVISLHPGESIQVFPNLPLAALPRDKGIFFRKALQVAEDTFRQLAQRPGGAPAGAANGPGPSTGGAQGDKGKNTGTGTGTGTGAPTGAPSGAPPNPPPPPPPPGGGGE